MGPFVRWATLAMLRFRMKFRRVPAVLIGTLLAISLPITLASAHTTLTSSAPANGSRVTSWPSDILLNFAEPLLIIKGSHVSQVEITNSLAQSVAGELTVSDTKISVATKPNSAAGPVLVNYRVAAADGHVVEGEFTFDFEPAGATTSPSPAPSSNDAHVHSANSSTIIKASTGLVVLALIIGTFVYRRKI